MTVAHSLFVTCRRSRVSKIVILGTNLGPTWKCTSVFSINSHWFHRGNKQFPGGCQRSPSLEPELRNTWASFLAIVSSSNCCLNCCHFSHKDCRNLFCLHPWKLWLAGILSKSVGICFLYTRHYMPPLCNCKHSSANPFTLQDDVSSKTRLWFDNTHTCVVISPSE